MDNNDSNTKSSQTGGLKLMTVFIAVLALHVVVIGGFTVYHLMSGGSSDVDFATTGKPHKDTIASTTDAAQPEKAPADAATTKASTDVASAPAATPPADATSPNEIVPPTPGPAPMLKPTPVATIPSNTKTPVAGTKPEPITLTASDPKFDNKLTSLPPSTDKLEAMAPMTVPGPTPAPAGTSSTPLATTPEPTPAPMATPSPAAQTPIASMGPVHMPPAAKAPSPTHVDAPTYTVKITDSYKKIAASHHITVAQLKAANHIKGDTLHSGQKLIIPSAGKSAVASSNSALDAAPASISLTEAPVAMTTAVKVKSTASTSTASSTGSHTYTIAKGDTLGKIAHKFKTTPEAIMAANNITDATKLTIGKKLKIPSKESRSAGNSVPIPAPIVPMEPAVQPQPEKPQVQTKSDEASAQLANYHTEASSDTNF